MTLNVAGALAMMLCLTVTSGQQEMGESKSNLPVSELSFTTEKENELLFEKNNTNLVKLYNDEEDAIGITIDLEGIKEAETEAEIEETEIEETAEAQTEEIKIEETETEEQVCRNRWEIQLTEEEIDLLAKILWVEARGESEAGQKAVVEVVFNRMVSEKFPDTLYDVLSQKKPVQFASWKLRDQAEPTEKEYTSIYAVLNGETSVVREDTVYFATKKLTRNLDVKIGGHYFCY